MTEIRSILEASSNLREGEADRVRLVLFAGCTKASYSLTAGALQTSWRTLLFVRIVHEAYRLECTHDQLSDI